MLLMACHCAATGSYRSGCSGERGVVWCGVPVSYVVVNEQIDSGICLRSICHYSLSGMERKGLVTHGITTNM